MRYFLPPHGTRHRSPLPTDCVRQINAAVSYFIWKGEIFKFPLSTHYLHSDSGDSALIHLMAKCMTLFILRMERQCQQIDSFTADWITKWNLHGRSPNPPDITRVPRKLDYIYRYNNEAAYTSVRGTLESQKSYKRRLCNGLLSSIKDAVGQPQMRIHKLWPDTTWIKIWKNLGEAPVPEYMRCIWYQIIHNLIPTNVRLRRIKVTPTNICQRCAATNTLEHRLTVCDEGTLIWQYTKTALARMLRTIPARIPNEWLIRRRFNIWSTKPNRAVLWTLANVVIFGLQHRTTLNLQDYMYFLFRSRRKLLNNRRGLDLVGNYLALLDLTPTGCTTGIGS